MGNRSIGAVLSHCSIFFRIPSRNCGGKQESNGNRLHSVCLLADHDCGIDGWNCFCNWIAGRKDIKEGVQDEREKK